LTPHYYSPVTECADVPDNAYRDGPVADHAVEHLRELVDHQKPFFLAVGFVKPHLAFGAPKRFWDLYNRDPIRLASATLEDDLARRLVHGYYACIRYIDAQVHGRELYDHTVDLRENTNIANKPAHQDLVAQLEKQLRDGL
jgi:arylsulfatase A-like enzyme